MLLKKISYNLIFNITLFLLLMIGIQNSTKGEKVNLVLKESVNLPVGFIFGISFISGSITGSLINFYLHNRKEF